MNRKRPRYQETQGGLGERSLFGGYRESANKRKKGMSHWDNSNSRRHTSSDDRGGRNSDFNGAHTTSSSFGRGHWPRASGDSSRSFGRSRDDRYRQSPERLSSGVDHFGVDDSDHGNIGGGLGRGQWSRHWQVSGRDDRYGSVDVSRSFPDIEVAPLIGGGAFDRGIWGQNSSDERRQHHSSPERRVDYDERSGQWQRGLREQGRNDRWNNTTDTVDVDYRSKLEGVVMQTSPHSRNLPMVPPDNWSQRVWNQKTDVDVSAGNYKPPARQTVYFSGRGSDDGEPSYRRNFDSHHAGELWEQARFNDELGFSGGATWGRQVPNQNQAIGPSGRGRGRLVRELSPPAQMWTGSSVPDSNLPAQYEDHYQEADNPFGVLPTSTQEDGEVPKSQLKVFLYRAGRPDYRFRHFQLNSFMSILGERIRAIPRGGFFPRFQKSTLQRGNIVVMPADLRSKQWLLMTLDEMRLFKFRIEASDHFMGPNKYKVFIYVREYPPPTTNDILYCLETQNPGLRTDTWKIIFSKEIEMVGTRLTVAIDQVSLEALQALNFKPYIRATQAKVTLLSPHDKGVTVRPTDLNSGSPPPTVMSTPAAPDQQPLLPKKKKNRKKKLIGFPAGPPPWIIKKQNQINKDEMADTKQKTESSKQVTPAVDAKPTPEEVVTSGKAVVKSGIRESEKTVEVKAIAETTIKNPSTESQEEFKKEGVEDSNKGGVDNSKKEVVDNSKKESVDNSKKESVENSKKEDVDNSKKNGVDNSKKEVAAKKENTDISNKDTINTIKKSADNMKNDNDDIKKEGVVPPKPTSS